jgi:hypothetical protein
MLVALADEIHGGVIDNTQTRLCLGVIATRSSSLRELDASLLVPSSHRPFLRLRVCIYAVIALLGQNTRRDVVPTQAGLCDPPAEHSKFSDTLQPSTGWPRRAAAVGGFAGVIPWTSGHA